MSEEEGRKLLDKLSRGIAYTAPVLAIVAGGAALHAIYSDAFGESGYQMTAVGEAEGEAEAEAEAEGEAEAEAEGEAEGVEAESEAEGEGEAEDHQ